MAVPIEPNRPPILTQSVGTGGNLEPYYIVNQDGNDPAELWIFNTDFQPLVFTVKDNTGNPIIQSQEALRTAPFIIHPGGTVKVEVAVQGNPNPDHAFTIPCYTEASPSTNCIISESSVREGY